MRKGAGRKENLARKSYGGKFWPINRMGGSCSINRMGGDFGRSPSVPISDGAIMLQGMAIMLPAQ